MFITETLTVPAPVDVVRGRLDALLTGGEATRVATEILQRLPSPQPEPTGETRLDHLPGYQRGGAVVFPLRWWMTLTDGQWLPLVDANLELSGHDQDTTVHYVGTARAWEPRSAGGEPELWAGAAAIEFLGRLAALLAVPPAAS
jgi:hypothetical protein